MILFTNSVTFLEAKICSFYYKNIFNQADGHPIVIIIEIVIINIRLTLLKLFSNYKKEVGDFSSPQ